jgi:tRNA G18 (ribose-2'-O)-methylase SpoU
VPPPERDLEWATGTLLRGVLAEGRPARVLAIEKSFDAANLGGMIRTARAFGVDLVRVHALRGSFALGRTCLAMAWLR